MIIVSQINPKALEVLNGNIKMSISSEIQRLQEAKKSINIALSRRGIHIPSGDTLDEYAALIDPITSGETIEYLDNPQGYLSFKFVTDGTVKWQNVKGDIEYSKNGGSTWTAFNGATVSATTGDEIWFKGSLTGGCGANTETGSSKFYTSGYFFASGNIQSLCGFYNTLQVYHFSYLFSKCSFLNIDENNKLLLPATTLADNCYSSMFQGCTSLTKAPVLPAEEMLTNCYGFMFNGCTNLNYIKCLATNPSNSILNHLTINWVNGVASSGTFVKNFAATWTSNCGTSTYPCNWTVETASA